MYRPSTWSADGQRALSIPHESANEAVDPTRCTNRGAIAECGTWLCELLLKEEIPSGVCQPSIWSADGQRALSIPHKSANEAVVSNKTGRTNGDAVRQSACALQNTGLGCMSFFSESKFLVVCTNGQSGVPMVRGLFRYLTKAANEAVGYNKTHESRRC
jgi:hypothetical protein